ncbi:putative proteasome-type protease [Tepidamorphus gemmatus]|uniref:Putative proteasome-type protease n=1 Tax=Tepidamorphus gemmatus TaxID=747076 RepID=A0A4R3MFQ1_9HYPH|nr:proteasome-type protease [Tepidamorphus gemmatus]TCT12689.1 putative proteasome-type protease [Tepidamorphus gemmatus]
MTYCVGILLNDGLVMIADTRTNAGLDNIATYRKLHIFERPGDRVVALCSAGNLAASQAVLSVLNEGLEEPGTAEPETIWTQPSMFKTAQFVGRAIREVYRIDGKALEQQAAGFDVTFLVGGQVKGGRLRLFMVYSAGNFIEATPDTPYLQIGEHKYGKPILDRAVRYDTDLYDALKLGLISMDSTMRSNLSVGMPIDLIMLRRDCLQLELNHRIEHDDPYFRDLQDRWSNALKAAHKAIQRPPYGATDCTARG